MCALSGMFSLTQTGNLSLKNYTILPGEGYNNTSQAVICRQVYLVILVISLNFDEDERFHQMYIFQNNCVLDIHRFKRLNQLESEPAL